MPKGVYERKPKPIIGEGINDLKWSGRKDKHTEYEVKVYNTWYDMLKRCYNEKELEKEPSYRGCLVCDRWKILSNFEKDIHLLDGYNEWINNKSYCLDKDILGQGKKIYAPEFCCFVTLSDNVKERNQRLGNPCLLHRKKIKCTYPNEKQIIFESINSTREYGFTIPNVMKVLQGVRHKHKGCVFHYVS